MKNNNLWRFQLWSTNKWNLCFKTSWKEIDNNVESSYLHVKVSVFSLSFTFSQLQTSWKRNWLVIFPLGKIGDTNEGILHKAKWQHQDQSFCVSRLLYLNSESNSLLNCTPTHAQISEVEQAFSEELLLSPKPPHILQMVISHMPHSLPFPWRSW